MQLTHHKSIFEKRLFPITLVCENLTNAANIGGLFRTADAFGVEKMIFCGNQFSLSRKIKKIARATNKYVVHEWHDDIKSVLKNFDASEYHIMALEITDDSIPLAQMKFSNDRPIALVMGDENLGISEACLSLSESIIHIDMFGQNSSMNVVQATTVVLYEMTKQLKDPVSS